MRDNRNLQLEISADEGQLIAKIIAFVFDLQIKNKNILNLEDIVKIRKIDNKIFDAIVLSIKENKIEN